MSQTRCGYIALLGAPNAGKSTLLNRLIGQKLAIVTPKAQTTRNRITGAMIHEQAQLIFVDVPGVFNPGESKKLEKAMVECAWNGAADADMVLMIMDARKGFDEENEAILERLEQLKKPASLVLNKIDVIDKEKLLALASEANERFGFEQIYMISALKGDGVEKLKSDMAEIMPEGPWLFPEDYLTDLSERLLASEITREKLFLRLREELPYALTVETEQWEEFDNGSIRMEQIVFVEREGQKGIVLGKQGSMLKQIGKDAREDMQKLWGCKVHLFLFVKVRENWKTNPDTYRYLGLNQKS
ncbi:MAG: GTPase Era [Rickettsiales bacterium]|nr:GTPase Era [Rickettsiales bacterium]